jgi:hypothetical protein
MKRSASAALVVILAAMLPGCGKQFDFTLAPTALTTSETTTHQPSNGCLDTMGEAGPSVSLGPGQIAVGSESAVGSGCETGDEEVTSYDRGAVKFDLSKIPAGASFAEAALTFEHAGGSEFDTGPTCVVTIGLATADWTAFAQDANTADFTAIPLDALNWTINQNSLDAAPAGANVNHYFSNKKSVYTVDLKPAFNYWFSSVSKFKKPNLGLVFRNTQYEPFDLGSSASCYELLGNFSLHVSGSS